MTPWYDDWGISISTEHTSSQEGPWSGGLHRQDGSPAVGGAVREQSILIPSEKLVDPTAAWAQPWSTVQFADREQMSTVFQPELHQSCVQLV